MLPAYGVTIGTYDHSDTHQGQWLHEILYLNTSGGQVYQCAVDVNEPSGEFQYMVLDKLDTGMFANISALSDGYHALDRNSTSGALDYIRSQLIQRPEGCLALLYAFINAIFHSNLNVWADVTGDEAGNALVNLVQGSTRVYVFGAPYANPNPYPGMHDIHMNQGDPVGSQWYASNGIWQDGGVIVTKPDGSLHGYFGKFANQSLRTDSNGNPI